MAEVYCNNLFAFITVGMLMHLSEGSKSVTSAVIFIHSSTKGTLCLHLRSLFTWFWRDFLTSCSIFVIFFLNLDVNESASKIVIFNRKYVVNYERGCIVFKDVYYKGPFKMLYINVLYKNVYVSIYTLS